MFSALYTTGISVISVISDESSFSHLVLSAKFKVTFGAQRQRTHRNKNYMNWQQIYSYFSKMNLFLYYAKSFKIYNASLEIRFFLHVFIALRVKKL